MIKAVLLDLDDTLLFNDDQVFVPAYLQAVERYFQATFNYSGMSKHIRTSLKAMMAPKSYAASNMQAAIDSIAAESAFPNETLSQGFAQFYAEAFPPLHSLTRPNPVAQPLVVWLQAQGIAVTIATNPVYPTQAIQQRLVWAGLSGNLSDYAFVTTGEAMHFAKPDPRYYIETIARLGVEPDETLMVGNSLENDISPARAVGIQTYHILKEGEPASQNSGTLNDLFHQFQQGWLETLEPIPVSPSMVLHELEGNLGALFGILAEVKPYQWMQHPDRREWSILQIVRHLAEREASVQRAELETILYQDNPFLMPSPLPPDPEESGDVWATAEAFVQAREVTLALLRPLPPEIWARPANHSTFGKTTLLEMAHFTAQHDRLHITQICQTLGKCD
ncbi:MAG: HAD family hydrolase [Phototrophicaceae bacterium]|jgi:FMN phosphatase YigB (HAD superfamily)